MDANYYADIQAMVQKAEDKLHRHEQGTAQDLGSVFRDISVACFDGNKIREEMTEVLRASEQNKFQTAVNRLGNVMSYSTSPNGNLIIHNALFEVGRVAKLLEEKKHGLVTAQQLVSRARFVAKILNAEAMTKAIDRLEGAIENDPALAIGTAKELIESCCKTILGKRGVEVLKTDEVGDLSKKLTTELRLVPRGVTNATKGEDVIRRILGNLTQIPSQLAELRNLYGTGHGADGNHQGLQSRHARLAAATAVAYIDFMTETYQHYEDGGYPSSDGV